MRSVAPRRVARAIIPVLAVLVMLLSSDASPPSGRSGVDRLSDRQTGEFYLSADGTRRRILNPSFERCAFPIAEIQPGARLLVSPGIEASDNNGPVYFGIVWTSGSEPAKLLYQRELSAPGWLEETVALPSAGPGELRLRMSTWPGQKRLLRHAGWGDPTLLSGPASGRMSVILVSLDTLRADRVGIYGRREARTPVLDALARNGVLYARAYSSSTWTQPSHQAMLFGLQPWALTTATLPSGQRGGWTFQGFESLAKAFRDAGYLTGAFTGGGYVSVLQGVATGFDTFFAYARKSSRRGKCDPARFDGAEVFKRAAGWLQDRAGAPFFLFVHTYEPHDRCPLLPGWHKPFRSLQKASETERAALVRYYDGLVTRTDTLVGDLLRTLDSLGLADSTLIAVTSDHGEGLWEHQFQGHGCPLPPYEELTRVPLLVRLPGSTRRGTRIDAPVSTIDLAPTLLTLAGVTVPNTMQGGVLPGLGLPAQADRPVYVHCQDWLSVREGDLKFIVSRAAQKRMLFNTADDPMELVDLVHEQSPARNRLLQLEKQYWAHIREGQQAHTARGTGDAVDPATAERLRALGYAE
jgi:arylsulfatase A-like enzyme